MCDCPCHAMGSATDECFCTPECIRGEPEPLPIPDDWWFAVEYHRPICVMLRRVHGIPAYEEGTGGHNYHVAYPWGENFLLADANEGVWRAGLYVGHDDVFACEHESVLIESDLTEQAPSEVVVDWLLGLPTEIPKEE